jgi:hypothetical protein
VSLGSDEGGVQVKELPVTPEPMTSTSPRLVLGPFLRVIVTGP